MPARDEELDQGKVKPFRTSTRLKLPPREVRPEDDSVYDRFLGSVENETAPHSLKRERDGVVNQVEPFSPSSSADTVSLHPLSQKTDPKFIESELPAKVLQAASFSQNTQGFNTDRFVRDINRVYRLNGGESLVLRSLLEMSHARGKDRCEVTVPRIMAQTDLTEQRVRRNIKSLRNKGWIRLVKEFDPYKHTAAIYEVFLSPS